MSARREAALGGSICLNNAGEALGWLNPNAISILFYSCCTEWRHVDAIACYL